MTDPLIIPVPETTGALYLVPWRTAADDRIGDRLRAALEARPPSLGRDASLQAIGTVLQVHLEPSRAADLPLEMIQAFGAEPDHLRLLAESPGVVTVQAAGLAGWPPIHELMARTSALALARSEGMPLLDTSTLQTMDAERAEASLPADGGIVLSKWIVIPQSVDEDGDLWITTKGLARFGLPELEVLGAAPQVSKAWTSILTGIALVLLRRCSQAIDECRAGRDDVAFVEIERNLTVSLADIAAAYGDDPPDEDASTLIQLVAAPSADLDQDPFLTVVPPDSYPHSRSEFSVDAGADLFGANETEIRHVASTDEMDVAMATAVSCLDVARDRLLAGEFGHRTLLMVKWRLETEHGGEYPWAYVHSWSDPQQLHGTSASDAECDPSVRVGRPLVLARGSIVDWGVWVDGDGIVEGGWTNAVLEGEPPPPIPKAGRRRRFGRRR